MGTGGIYIRWQDRLWQEQPDGSYLVWNEETRVWETSKQQPPAEPGRTIATKECPNCGKRVKTSLRSCPYCDHALDVPAAAEKAAPEARPAPKRARLERRGPLIVGLALVLAIGVPVGLVKYRQDQLCERWKAGVRALTETTIRVKGPPPGVTEAELHELNEDRMADRRPGGCG